MNLQSYLEMLGKTLSDTVTQYQFKSENNVRLYKSDMSVDELDSLIHQNIQVKMDTVNLHYIELDNLVYLDPAKYQTFEDCQIAPNDTVIIDVFESGRYWGVNSKSSDLQFDPVPENGGK